MSRDVARLFDGMAGSYDQLEPWYEHLYATLHAIAREVLAPRAGAAARALDAGCGTGFQTAVLDRLGYQVHGLDLSAGLLAVARRAHPTARLARGDLEALPYDADSFDAATCCGSTLSLVEDAGRALAELARVLRPGARLLVEVEHRWSPDVGWMLAGALARDALGYGASLRDAWRALARPLAGPCWIDYPAGPPAGAGFRLRLFAGRELRRLMTGAGLHWQRCWGIHALTNFIPSTVLHRPRLPAPCGPRMPPSAPSSAGCGPGARSPGWPAAWSCRRRSAGRAIDRPAPAPGQSTPPCRAATSSPASGSSCR